MMMRMAGELGIRVIANIMQRLWRNPDSDWEESLHEAVGVCLWKRKGDLI